MHGGQGFDTARFERAYNSFTAAYEEEDDRSGGRGASRVFKDEGADLIDAAAGHSEREALRTAVQQRNRGAIASIAGRIIAKSAA